MSRRGRAAGPGEAGARKRGARSEPWDGGALHRPTPGAEQAVLGGHPQLPSGLGWVGSGSGALGRELRVSVRSLAPA